MSCNFFIYYSILVTIFLISLAFYTIYLFLKNKSTKEVLEEKIKVIEDLKNNMTDTFKSLSSETLRIANEDFLKSANLTFEKYQQIAKNELEKKQEKIEDVLKPIKESLESFDKKVQDIEKNRLGAYVELREQVKNLKDTNDLLKKDTSSLVQALRTPHVRGKWGEMQLRRSVELAGMMEYCDFIEQESTTDSEDKILRPDMLVKLPGNMTIVIDAKTPLHSYTEYIEATNDDIKKEKLKNHVDNIRKHIRELSKKAYWEQFENTPEFVVLFLPGEVFFSSVVTEAPNIIEESIKQKIIIATPINLISLLKTISYGWKQEKLNKNSLELKNIGQELYKRIFDMSSHLSDLGVKLNSAVESYNKSANSFESRVLITANKFNDLGLEEPEKDKKPSLIDRRARTLNK